MRRGQLAVEMIVVASLLLLLGTAVAGQAALQEPLARVHLRRSDAIVIAEGAASVLNGLVLSGNGSTAAIRVPDTLPDGTLLSVSVRSRLLELRWDDATVQVPLLAGAVSGELVPGTTSSAVYAEGVLRLA